MSAFRQKQWLPTREREEVPGKARRHKNPNLNVTFSYTESFLP
jgi:hypothetical protein